MQLKTKAGLALVVLGMGIFGAWNWWTKTRNFVPVNVPVPLAAGQSVTSHFKLNFDGSYLIAIEAEKTIPLDTLHCLMGVDADPVTCKDHSPAVAASWVISSKGLEVKHGSSSELHSENTDSDAVVRVIGEFQGKAGQEYSLQVAVTAASIGLAAAHPQLKVTVASIAHSDLQSAGVLVFSMVFVCVLFGAILLTIAFYVKRRANLV